MVSDKWQYRYGIHERSMHEKRGKGQFAGRILNYSRSVMQRMFKAGQLMIDGSAGMGRTIGRDNDKFKLHAQKFKTGFKEAVGYFMMSYALDGIYRSVAYPLDSKSQSSWNFFSQMGGELYSFAETIQEPLAPIATVFGYFEAQDAFYRGEISKKEMERQNKVLTKNLLSAADRMSTQMLYGVDWLGIRLFEATMHRRDVALIQNSIDIALGKRSQYGEDYQRSFVNASKYWMFGEGWDKWRRKSEERDKKKSY